MDANDGEDEGEESAEDEKLPRKKRRRDGLPRVNPMRLESACWSGGLCDAPKLGALVAHVLARCCWFWPEEVRFWVCCDCPAGWFRPMVECSARAVGAIFAVLDPR